MRLGARPFKPTHLQQGEPSLRVLLIGATGRLGAAVRDALRDRHEVITASRSDGDLTVDVTDPSTIAAMYEDGGRVDAVACAFGRCPTSLFGSSRPTIFDRASPTSCSARWSSCAKASNTSPPARQRINAVSPTVFTEALDAYGSYFPGFLPVPLRDVAATFVRSIEGPQTGQIDQLGN